MKLNLKTIFTVTGFSLTIVLVFSIIIALGRVEYQIVGGQAGLVDLRAVDLSATAVQTLSWEHIPGRLLFPAETGSDAGEQTGENVPFGSYRMRILTPDNEPCTVEFMSLSFSSRVFIGGLEVDQIGTVAAAKDASVPETAYCRYFVTPQDNAVEIILQYANFVTSQNDPTTLRIGHSGLMSEKQIHSNFYSCLMIAVYVAAFLLNFGLFLFRPGQLENLYFSLACLLQALREGLAGEQILSVMLPNIPWGVMFSAQYLFIGLLAALILAFIDRLFPPLVQKAAKYAFFAVSALYALLILITEPRMYDFLRISYLAAVIAAIVYLVIRICPRFKTLAFDQYLSAFGLLFLFAAVLNDILFYAHTPLLLLGSRAYMQPAMIVFIFAQMVALFLQFARAERELGEVTERENTLTGQNEALQQIDRQRVRFLSTVSHELKTPLTVISNYAQLTRQHERESDRQDEYVVNKMLLVSSEVERLAMMVGQLLDIARIEEGRMEWSFRRVNMNVLIAEMIETYFPVLNKNHNKLNADIAAFLPGVYADEARIKQVLVNLISNAIKFTHDGTITVSARLEEGGVRVTVSDTGIGIPEQQLALIFERYYTGSERGGQNASGTGLGLFISRQIIEAHHGKISVTSIQGSGTTVFFWLPAQEGEELP